MTKPQRLTAKERRFIVEYQVDRCGTKAAIRAGYGEAYASQTAWRMLKKPHIKAAIAEADAKAEEKAELTKADIEAMLIKAAEDATRDKHHSARVRAIELLGKQRGMFKEDVRVELTRTSDADLIEAIAKGNPALAAMLRTRLTGQDDDTPASTH